ncbi:PQQ-binding-like beta-propeller repeat protein [candidate division KSB1 bacterium]|nr:PQQ-binding-like beta-propeller repeat protein [candidate division KSB1 bacterium]
MEKRTKLLLLIILILIQFSLPVFSADWPMWRFDEGRSACSPEELPAKLEPIWTWQFSQRETVWDDPLNQDMMPFDQVFEPVIMGKTLFVGFNDKDKVVALNTDTGGKKWTFYTDGPVRLPFAAAKNKVYFTSDDGYLYCLSAEKGELIWKFRGGPKDRKILGNKRLISTWPARGGVVLKDDTIYFAASIWPFMGTFIYALNAETGAIIWRNEATGSKYMLQPHNSPAFAGVAPQGIFVISGDYVLVPGGRSVPACFNRFTGEMLYYHLAQYNKTGGAFVCANDEFFFNYFRDRDTNVFDVKTGDIVERRMGEYPVLAKDAFYMSGDSIIIRDAKKPQNVISVVKVDASGDLIKAGSRLYAGGEHQITSIKINDANQAATVEWSTQIDGHVRRLCAADGKLFAVTLDGRIMAYGVKQKKPFIYIDKPDKWIPSLTTTNSANTILETTGVSEGYALLYGPGNGDLLAALAMNSKLNFIAVESDPVKVNDLRKRFDRLGLLGLRVSILQGTYSDFPAPPYMASLIVMQETVPNPMLKGETDLQIVFKALRPYGGKLWLASVKHDINYFKNLAAGYLATELSVFSQDKNIIIAKDGKLKGAANWTHQYGNIANTVKSEDEVVKLPLGLLWFGGNSNEDVLPRHGHGPPEQIVDGRLIIEGMDCLSARDVYTGRVLWQTRIDSLDTFGDYFNETYEYAPLDPSGNQEHLPGANSRGTNFVATTDYVYIIVGSECKVLDIVTGKPVKSLSLPPIQGDKIPEWAYIGVQDSLLIAGSGFVPFSLLESIAETEQIKELSSKDQHKYKIFNNFDNNSSQKLVVMNRYTGKVKWEIEAKYGFIHNAITASKDILYCLDKMPPSIERKRERRGLDIPTDYRLMALKIDTGQELWAVTTGIFGSWLSYSEEYNRLLQATRPSRDMVTDEVGKRMSVYNATTGELIWDRPLKYNNPPILHNKKIITDNSAYDLENGEAIFRIDPITETNFQWTYSRTYGCNYNIASENLLSFRSAAAGFYDFMNEGGTGNLGGFKSGCTSNLIAAGGVLNAPDYTRTCQCSYQNQTSLAFIHMPELDYWTTNDFDWNGEPVRHIGVNLNAPGDRISEDGTLWLDFPSVGGKSPDIPIKYDSTNTNGLRRHVFNMQGNEYKWVGSSALTGPLDLMLTLEKEPVKSSTYTVHLLFAELENKAPGDRIFDVFIQDKNVLNDFDIVKEAGIENKTIIKTFRDVNVAGTLKISCVPSNMDTDSLPLLCGIELIRE